MLRNIPIQFRRTAWLPLLAIAASLSTELTAMSADESVAASDEQAAQEPVGFIEIVHDGQTIRLPIEDGQVGDIQVGGAKWRLQLSPVTGAADGSSTVEPRDDFRSAGDNPAVSPTTIALAVVLVALLAALLFYFLVFEPWRRRKPLREALTIIRQDQRPLYPQAEELLNQSLLAGLRKKDVALARFMLAFLRATLGKHAEAATVLGDLEASKVKLDRPAAYLMLWVHSRLKNHERVERIYGEYQELLRGYQQSALIVSISYLELAALRMTRREINGALHYYHEVRKLEELADEIPSHLDDHEVVTGIVALFEKNREEAEKHFRAAVQTALDREKPASAARLGLLLCKWQDRKSPDVDQELGKLLLAMPIAPAGTNNRSLPTQCPHCGRRYRVNAVYEQNKVQCKGCRRRFLVATRDAPEESQDGEQREAPVSDDRLLSEDDLLLRNARLWHCVTLLITWLYRDERSGVAEADRTELLDRLHIVSSLDPDMGDPYLIEGLITYFFAEDEEERKLGHKLIEKAVELEVHVPEVLQLLDRVNKLAALSEHSLSYFHQLSAQYAENGEVDPELRQHFVRTMNRYSRFRNLGTIEPLAKEEAVAPSLENLQGRGHILQTRVSNIVRYRLSEDDASLREDISKQLDQLQEHSQMLANNTRAFQQTEFGLMESTGEFLFRDEDDEEHAAPAAESTDADASAGNASEHAKNAEDGKGEG